MIIPLLVEVTRTWYANDKGREAQGWSNCDSQTSFQRPWQFCRSARLPTGLLEVVIGQRDRKWHECLTTYLVSKTVSAVPLQRDRNATRFEGKSAVMHPWFPGQPVFRACPGD
jgi:hypothetical protein